MCMIPWTGIETQPLGGYRPCCVYRDKIRDDDGVPFNVQKHTIKEVQNSTYMQNLREQFRRGEKPPGCITCWKEEASGKKSKRQHQWDKSSTVGEIAIKKEQIMTAIIDLKLGNICNLKCRICWSGSSSQWAADMIKIDPSQEAVWRKDLKDGAWPRNENVFFKSLEGSLDQVRYFEITGGEPLMIKEQFDVLQKCVDRGLAKNIDVHYNTNGTHFPEKELNEIWPHFKRIEIAFSIDDIADRFEYQRYPAKWDLVNENIIKFKNSGLKNLSTQVCTTINVFNMAYLDDLAPYIDTWEPDFWYINTLHQPEEFDVQQLPNDVKKTITSKLLKTKTRKDEITTALNYLNSEPNPVFENYKELLVQRIKQIDNHRKENFADVFPFLNNILRIYE